MKINEAAHVTLFHDGEGRGGTGKEFAREGTGSTKPVGTRGAFGKILTKAMAKKVETRRDMKELPYTVGVAGKGWAD